MFSRSSHSAFLCVNVLCVFYLVQHLWENKHLVRQQRGARCLALRVARALRSMEDYAVYVVRVTGPVLVPFGTSLWGIVICCNGFWEACDVFFLIIGTLCFWRFHIRTCFLYINILIPSHLNKYIVSSYE